MSDSDVSTRLVPGDSPSQAERSQDILVQLAFTTGLFPVLIAAFCAIHYWRPLERIYFPDDPSRRTTLSRNGLPTRRISSRSPWIWVKAIWNSTMEDVLQECGADGALVFCAVEFGIKLFVTCSVVGILAVLPVHIRHVNSQPTGRTELYTIDNIPNGSRALFVHLGATWFIALAFYYLLYTTYHKVLAIKNRYMLFTGPSSRTILVDGISDDLTETELHIYFESLGIGPVEKVVVLRHSHELLDAISERWKWLLRAERIATEIEDGTEHLRELRDTMATTNLPSPRATEATSFLAHQARLAEPPRQTFTKRLRWFFMSPGERLQHAKDRFREADDRVQVMRRDFVRYSKRVPSAYVMFRHPVSESIATQAMVHGSLTEMRVVRAPPPAEVRFHNLSIQPGIASARFVLVAAAMFFLIFFWAVPIGAVSSLLSLEELVQILPGLQAVLDQSPVITKFIQQILPTLAVTIFLSLLPVILDILGRIRGFRSISENNLFVFTAYFYFQLFNVLLVFTIAGTVFKAFEDILDRPSSLPELLARSLPKVSPFFVNLVMLHAFVLIPLVLLQIGATIVDGFLRQPVTPREHFLARKRQVWKFFEFAPTVLIMVIGLVYSLVVPLILPFCLVYTVIAWGVWRYRLHYQVSVSETQGKFWIEFVRMVHYGLTIFVLLMIGILSLKKFYWSFFLIPLLGIIGMGWYWITYMERRVANVPLDVWREWRGDTITEEADDIDGFCQGITGIDRLPIRFGYDNVLVHGVLPTPWLPGELTPPRVNTPESGSNTSSAGSLPRALVGIKVESPPVGPRSAARPASASRLGRRPLSAGPDEEEIGVIVDEDGTTPVPTTADDDEASVLRSVAGSKYGSAAELV
ncbi:hypothetical protein GGF32_007959 [Allomyces javanicus]|nr:hypothetical protein GGF32_007959 [Allomyces javanicus]